MHGPIPSSETDERGMKPSHMIVHWTSLLLSNITGRPPRLAKHDGAAEQRQFRHHDWSALLTRFVQDGRVDYAGFVRVRRLLEAYLDRVSEARPDELAGADEQLAFYLNVFNAIVVHQVLLHYPIVSFRDIPAAFARPYPVGRENLSLHGLLHAKIRAYGDPRVHAAVVPAARSAPKLRVYTGVGLQQELQEQMQAFLADPARGLHVEQSTRTLVLPHIFRWFAGDFAAPSRMPSLTLSVRGLIRPSIALPFLQPYVSPAVSEMLRDSGTRLRFLPYNQALNDIENGSRRTHDAFVLRPPTPDP